MQTDMIVEFSQIMRVNGIKTLEIKNVEEEIKIELFPLNEKENEKGIVSEPSANCDVITAPIMGIGYAYPPNRNKPFVSVGDKVIKGNVLCIIEVMKVLNEITAEYDCEIQEVCFENGAIVEFGQALFKVKRADVQNAHQGISC